MAARLRLMGRRLVLLLSAGIVALSFIPTPLAEAILPMAGDGFLYYATQNSATSPYKDYTAIGNTWSAASTLGTEPNAIHFERTVNSPISNERLVMISNTNGQYRMYRFDGSAWVLDWTDTGGGGSANTYTPRFDIAYGSDGNAVAFYSTDIGTTGQIGYRRYTAATKTWSAETAYTAGAVTAPGPTRMIRVENRPGTDEFAFVWGDYNQNLSGNYYDFSANAMSGEPAASLQNNLSITSAMESSGGPQYLFQTKVFDIAFETNSGDLLVCFGDDYGTDLNCVPRSAGTAGAWGSRVVYTAINIETVDIDLASDPNPASNQIAMVGYDSDLSDVEAAIWSGTAWGNRSALDASADTLEIGTSNVSVGWVRSGATSAAVVTYDDLNAGGIDWATFVSGTWTLRADSTTAFSPVNTNDKWHELVSNPNNTAELASLIIDGNNDLSVKRMAFDGTNFAWTSMDNGSATHNPTMHTTAGWAVAFAFARYIIPPVLSVDIVDDSDASVASPSITLAPLASSTTCQTTTGTLGTSTQKVRVSNGTTNAQWSLSVAPTGGVDANWTATTDSYDFNDPTTSGCVDGGTDADTLAGQLGFGPSTGTVTPVSSCTTTGVTTPSTTYFSHGVVNSIGLLTGGSTSSIGCYWDLTAVNIYQTIPRFQLAGTYSIPLTLTVTAN